MYSYIVRNNIVYCTSNFSMYTEVRCDYNYNVETDELIITPAEPAFAIKNRNIFAVFNWNRKPNWGNAPKYYLVRSIDSQTGKKLVKPLVTLFTVKAELDTPQLKFRVDEEGRFLFYWDRIEGADSYIIGWVIMENGVILFDYIDKIDTVTENEWRKPGETITLNKDTAFLGYDYPDWYLESASYQNDDYEFRATINAGYFVIAVNKGGNSNISNIIPYDAFAPLCPYKPEFYSYGEYSSYGGQLVLKYESDTVYVDDPMNAPVYQSIEMTDGSTKLFIIDYPDNLTGVDTYQLVNTKFDRIITSTRGTLFKNGIIIEDMRGYSMQDVLTYLNMREEMALRAAGGLAYVDIAINETPNVDTDFGNYSDSGIVNIDGTAEVYDGAASDDESIEYELCDIYANSALSAFLALNFTNHIEKIPLRGFPEASDGESLVDAILEAYYQNNCYIGGIELNRLKYDYRTRILTVPYAMTIEEQRVLKDEVIAQADAIVARIINDGMSDYQKEEAINNYICEYAEYDFDALEEMLNMPQFNIISEKYKYGQTAYGVLVDGKGICQSYAEAFKLLADRAGLQSIIVTGVLNGAGGHAWNRVLLDGQWFTIDPTNNDNDDFYNEFFNMPDEVAAAIVTENNEYALDNLLGGFSASQYGYDYYSRNGMNTELTGLGGYLADKLEAGARFGVYIDDLPVISEDDLVEALIETAQSSDVTFTPRMLLWVLRIECE